MKLRDFLLRATYDHILLETPDDIEIYLIRSEVHAVDLLYVNEITEIYDSLKEKYDETVAMTLLSLAISARNADHMNANVCGSLTVKER